MGNQHESIVLIGAGNVGFHLGKRLKTCGLNIVQIVSRSEEKAHRLSEITQVPYVTDLENITSDADLYILAVNDTAIEAVAAHLNVKTNHSLVAHTSGATPSNILAPYCTRFGVFYPLQTFSIAQSVDFEQIPICIDANHASDVDFLFKIGRRISQKVYHIDDHQRGVLHVAAVFVNNFANYLFQIGYNILEKEHLSFDLLRPLIQETATKVQQHPPTEMQTGPAIRGDEQTIKRHLQYLEQFPAYQELYQILTKNIQTEARNDRDGGT